MKNQQPPTRDQQTIQKLGDLLKDLQYLNRMKELELEYYSTNHTHLDQNNLNNVNSPSVGNSSSNSNKKAGLSDIVPISGIILGRFHRLDNELRTVYDHWKDKLPQQQK